MDGNSAVFANAIKSMEIEIESPDQRFTFIRDVNGNGSLTLHPGTHPGQPDNSGVQEISAAVQGDLAENALGTISINLIGRAKNRPIFDDPDLGVRFAEPGRRRAIRDPVDRILGRLGRARPDRERGLPHLRHRPWG